MLEQGARVVTRTLSAVVSARPRIVRVALRLVASGVIVVGFTLMTVGIGPFSGGLRLVNTMSGILIIGAGGLILFETRPDLVRFILGGIAAGTFAIAVATARRQDITDLDLLLPMLLSLSLVGFEILSGVNRPNDQRQDSTSPHP